MWKNIGQGILETQRARPSLCAMRASSRAGSCASARLAGPPRSCQPAVSRQPWCPSRQRPRPIDQATNPRVRKAGTAFPRHPEVVGPSTAPTISVQILSATFSGNALRAQDRGDDPSENPKVRWERDFQAKAMQYQANALFRVGVCTACGNVEKRVEKRRSRDAAAVQPHPGRCFDCGRYVRHSTNSSLTCAVLGRPSCSTPIEPPSAKRCRRRY